MSVGIKPATVLRTSARFLTIHQPEATTRASAATWRAKEMARCDARIGNVMLPVLNGGGIMDSLDARGFDMTGGCAAGRTLKALSNVAWVRRLSRGSVRRTR